MKAKRSLGRAVFFICLMLLANSSDAQIIVPPGASDTGLGGANVISGMVLSANGQRIERRISIRLQTMTRGDRVTMTDDNGTFTFRGLVSGDYVIVVDKEKGFEPFSQNVNIMQARGFPGQIYNLSIRLNPKPSTEAKPAVLNVEFANVPKAALDLYNRAIEMAKSGDRQGAIEQLRLAIAEHPKFMMAFNEIGVQYLRMNELDKADESFKVAIEIEPEAYTPLMNRGIVLFQMKRYGEAETIVRNALKIKEQSAVGHYFLGQTLANLGKFDEAEKELNASLALESTGMNEGRRVLAIIYSSKGDRKRAADVLEEYLRISPQAKDSEQLRNTIKQLRN